MGGWMGGRKAGLRIAYIDQKGRDSQEAKKTIFYDYVS